MANPAFGRLLGWLKGGTREANIGATQQCILELPTRINALAHAGVTREIAQQWAGFYRAEAARVATNPNALARAQLMQAIADLLP
ncbi:MAG TPA: hypothetical protein PKD53_08645 [Chloroflexaceae bacterium]|nr:hypothetical protein [Chloroflexaceae bacterium]